MVRLHTCLYFGGLALIASAAEEAGSVTAQASPPSVSLEKTFHSPPVESKPWVFWWFEGGYGGVEGMRRDIAAMKEQGIGGVLHMQTVNSGGLPVPAKPKMLSPEWETWFGPALGLAHDTGIVMCASIVDGWAHGGWWVRAEIKLRQSRCSHPGQNSNTSNPSSE
jgi:hypothetical protein